MSLVADLGVEDDLRGFSTNVANYQALGELCPWGHDCIQVRIMPCNAT